MMMPDDLKKIKKEIKMTWAKMAFELGYKDPRILYVYAKGQLKIPKRVEFSINALKYKILILKNRVVLLNPDYT